MPHCGVRTLGAAPLEARNQNASTSGQESIPPQCLVVLGLRESPAGPSWPRWPRGRGDAPGGPNGAERWLPK